MLNEKNLPQQSVEFTDLVDSEMEQISGGDKIIQIFNPYSFAAPYGFIGPGYGGGYGGGGKKKGHYK